jgi:UDP-2,3-diacylglucosamine pyrophosphatase LpxH
LETAPTVEFDDTSKLVLFSDCHRGDESWADDFAPNQGIYLHALRYYYDAGFTYIELGDGDELFESQDFEVIRDAHYHVFDMLRTFYTDDRLYLLYGNHNMYWRDPQQVRQHLFAYATDGDRRRALFDGIQVHEGLILRHMDGGPRFLLVHGHQGDFMCETLWRVTEFLSFKVWLPLQRFGVQNPSSPAKNNLKRVKLEQQIIRWIAAHDQPVICGHMHRAALPRPGAPRYFNAGCCVYPRYITCIEIAEGAIALVRWGILPNDQGVLKVTRELMETPQPLAAYSTS